MLKKCVFGLKKPQFEVISRSILTSAQSEAFYNDEQKELQNNLIKLIETEINPHCAQWEKDKMFPAKEVFKKMGDAGFLGINKPAEYGGSNLGYRYEMAYLEAIGHIASPGIGMALAVQTDMATPALTKFGSDELKRNYLAPALAGDAVACIGVSEPAAGSDVAGLKTKAVRKGDDWIINGEKMWITNSLQADWMCLLANTKDSGKMHENKSLIIVPMDTKGVIKAKNISKIGMNSSDTGHIFFEDVRVPVKNTVGQENLGFTYQMLQFQEERMAGALGVLAPLSRCIEETIEYTRNRKAFGMSLLDNQVIHFRLAELMTELEIFRSGVYAAGSTVERGEDVTYLASMLKLKAGRLAREVSDACLQYWGGMGFTDEVFVSQYYRDGRLLSIGGGADEVMLGIICKYMGILPSFKKK